MSKTPRTDDHLRMKEENGHAVIVNSEFARQLETELAEARAEIERLKQLWSCNLDIIGGELNKQLSEARAEIERLKKLQQFATAINCAMLEADFDPEYLRGHECVAKHKLLSMLDLWRKKVKPRLPGFINDEIYKRDKLIEQMREALKLALLYVPDNATDAVRISEAALDAAERGE